MGRMRRQPKVWEVKKNGPAKAPTFHAAAAETRVRARLESIKQLAFDEEETHLQSYAQPLT